MKSLIQSRRRFIGIFAAASGLSMGPGLLPHALAMSSDAPKPVNWRGVALGADAELRIYHSDSAMARKLIAMALAEVRRLEKIFSLYEENSALSVLNRQGYLDHPPSDLLHLLGDSQYFSHLTGGAFDPTVQPLWNVYASHFSVPGADPAGPGDAAVAAALALVDYQAMEIDTMRIGFSRPGMAITLNGIAQGYITDRIVHLLRDAGLDQALVDMGEIHGLNKADSGAPWRVGIADPQHPDQVLETIEIRNQALATSGGYGTVIDAAGQFTHIFDPKTGQSQPRYRSVSVTAANATAADALSTAFSNMSLAQAKQIVVKQQAKAWFALPEGSSTVIEG